MKKREKQWPDLSPAQAAIVQAQTNIWGLMQARRLGARQLGKLAGLTESQIVALLEYDADPDLKTLARVFHAMGAELHIHVGPLPEKAKNP